jgi:peptidoglycan/LPS O-acetylase OafA/YrhL
MSALGANDKPPNLSRRGRSIAVVAWSAFLAAAIGTVLCFAFVDPDALRDGLAPEWWTDRLTVYALGFGLLLAVAIVAAAMAVYLVRTEQES